MFDKGDFVLYYTRDSKFKFYEQKLGLFEASKASRILFGGDDLIQREMSWNVQEYGTL